MKNLFILGIVILLGGCGGGGGGNETSLGNSQPAIDSTTHYETSQPLADNTSTNSFNVLLMGNSHVRGIRSILETVISHGQPDKAINVQTTPGLRFLSDRVEDGVSEQTLDGELWTHVILQAQKYSSTGTMTYPTTAAEYWIRGAKELGATPVLFPEHPRRGNTWEGQTLYELHWGIAQNENACVAAVGLVWDEVLFRDPALVLHQADGNHASETGLFLSALVFYQIITGQTAGFDPGDSRHRYRTGYTTVAQGHSIIGAFSVPALCL